MEEITRRVRGWRLVDGVARPRVPSDYVGGCHGVGERRQDSEGRTLSPRTAAGLEAPFEHHARRVRAGGGQFIGSRVHG